MVISILIILITMLWGYAWVLMKISLEYMGPFTFSALRFIVGSLVMLAVVYWKRIPRPKREDWPFLFLLGLFQTTMVFSFAMIGLMYTGAGKASVIQFSMPIWSMILSYYFLNEKITVRKTFGIIMGGIGLVFLIGWGAIESFEQMVGGMVILLAAIAWASANIVLKKKFASHNKLQVSAWQMVFGTVGIVLFALLLEWDRPIIVTNISIFCILFCGVIASAFCFTSWFYVLSRLDTTVASMCLLLVPVFGLFFGWLQLNEVINIGTLLGILFIILGVYFTTSSRRHKGFEKMRHDL